jgi:hypothetical protein
MRRGLYAGLLVTGGWLALSPGVADAQQVRCPEGRTAGGQCVNAALADAMRQIAIIFSQPKLSQTAYPVLPSDQLHPGDPIRPLGDRYFRYPNQLNPDPLKPSRTIAPN